MSEVEETEPGALDSDAVGRSDPMAHPAVSSSPPELTPEERAQDVHLALNSRRKWRRAPDGELVCPLCGSKVPDDLRARPQHIEHHKRLERMAAACGLPPGHIAITIDHARLADQARHHAVVTVAVCLLVVLLMAVVIVVLTV